MCSVYSWCLISFNGFASRKRVKEWCADVKILISVFVGCEIVELWIAKMEIEQGYCHTYVATWTFGMMCNKLRQWNAFHIYCVYVRVREVWVIRPNYTQNMYTMPWHCHCRLLFADFHFQTRFNRPVNII